MSIALGTAIAYMTLDIKGFQSGMKEVEKSMENLKQNSNDASSKLDLMGTTFASLGTSLTKNVTVPLVGLAAQSIKTATEFEGAMLDVKKLSGATGDEFEQLKSKAAEMGEATVFTAKESADAMGYMALAGWKTKDMIAGIEPILNLAAAAGTDLALTSDIVTDNLTAFGMSATETTRFVDVMAATMANSNTTVEMLGESFKYCAPIAKTLGFSLEDTSLALGLMANSGIKASQAGTTLRKALTSMAAPTDKAKAVMEQYGISLVDSEGKSKSLRQIMIDLRETFGYLSLDVVDSNGNLKTYEQLMSEAANSTEKQANMQAIQAANTIFGKTAMSGMLAIINSSDESWDKLAGAIDNSNGATQEMVDIMSQGLGYQFEILKSAIEELGRQFGEILKPMAMGVVKALQKLFQLFIAIPKPIKVVITVIAGLVAAIGPLLLIVGSITLALPKLALALEAGKLAFMTFGSIIGTRVVSVLRTLAVVLRFPLVALGDLARLIKSVVLGVLGKLSSALKLLWGLMAANPITLVIAAIAALAGGFILLYNKCDWFKDMWNKTWRKIRLAFEEVKQALQPSIQEMGEQAGRVFTVLKDLVMDVADNISQAVGKAADAFVDFVNSEGFKKFMGFLVSGVADAAIFWIEQLGKGLETLGFIASECLESLSLLFEGEWQEALSNLGGMFATLAGKLEAELRKLPIIAKKWLSDTWLSIKDTVMNWPIGPLIQDLFGGLGLVIDLVSDFLATVFGVIKSALQGEWEEVGQQLVDFLLRLPDYLWRGLVWLGDFVADVMVMLVELLESALGSLAEWIGQWLSGLWEDLSTWWNTKMEELGEWFASIPDRVGEALNSLFETLGEWTDGLGEWFSSLWDTICQSLDTFFWETLPDLLGQAVGMLATLIVDFFTEIGTFIGKTLPEWGMKIWDEMCTWPGKFQKWFDGVVQKATKWKDDMITKAKEMGQQFVDWCITNIKELPGRISSWFNIVYNKALDWKDKMVQKAKEMARNFVNSCIDFIKDLPNRIRQIFTQTEGKADQHKTNMGTKGREAGNNFGSKLREAMKNLPSQMKNIGSDLVRGLWNGISSLGSWLWGKASGWADNFIRGVKKKFKINSPSRVFRDEIGLNLVRGMSEGMSKGQGELLRVANSMSTALVNQFNDPIKLGLQATTGFDSIDPITNSSQNQFVFNIGNVNNTREQDIEELANELTFYIKQRM